MSSLTKNEDWNDGYQRRGEMPELKFGWRDHLNGLIAARIEGIGLDGSSMLEIGAGDSQWLPYLAAKYPTARFAGLDYSVAGCERLAARSARLGNGAKIEVHQQDLFAETSPLHSQFRIVTSFGVVEHFTDLSHVLKAKRRYATEDGILFTLIPNMAGSIGRITKALDRTVYESHNPHDLASFIDGHKHAGLRVISAGYLGSSNFGVLSSCFRKPGGIAWEAYVLLTRLSKAGWFYESRGGHLPVSKLFSPYIYVISKAIN